MKNLLFLNFNTFFFFALKFAFASLNIIAELIAKSLNIMMKNINDFVQHATKLTSDSVNSYNDYLFNALDSVDSNIKKMYQIMAKCEELSIQMQPIKQLQIDIEKVNKLLDLLDKELDTKIKE